MQIQPVAEKGDRKPGQGDFSSWTEAAVSRPEGTNQGGTVTARAYGW